ncbi:AraC family transcriptional regulator [Paenibacillus sp. NPDC058071]|uniref:helix-turn-helix transcriptional regulator n=1 Tax=Paenibacillus sp. NPDC058071 TaxID=3346326 RepID=UPI0036DB23D0
MILDTISFPTLTETDQQLPIFCTSVGHWDNQESIDRDSFPDFQWLQVTSGEGGLYIGEERFSVKAGQGFCLFPHVRHRYYAVHEPWEVYFLSFNGAMAEALLGQAGIHRSGVYSTADGEMIVSHLRSLYTLTQSGRAFLGIECSKLVYLFLLDLIKVIMVSSQSAGQHYSKLQPVLRHIEANIGSVITIKELAAQIDVTPQYLCLLFKNAMGLRPMAFVNRERINRSKELMFRENEHKMQEIAALVGFESASYFSYVFRKYEGVSPEQFKKIHGIR